MNPDQDLGALQVDDLDSVVAAFISWAGGSQVVRVLHTPEVALAVDTKERRGFLLDEIYFATLWADRGRSELQTVLTEALAAAGKDPPVPGAIEASPHDLIGRVMRDGHRIEAKL